MSKYTSMLDPPRLVTSATPGAAIAYCYRAAIELAVSEWRTVEFTHNDVRHIVRPDDLMDCVIRVEPTP